MAGRFKRTKDVGPQSSSSRGGGHGGGRAANLSATTMGSSGPTALQRQQQREALEEANMALDAAFGFERLRTAPPEGMKPAYMFNMRQSRIEDIETHLELSCLDMYFVQETGATFKASHIFQPYFLIQVKGNASIFGEVEQYLLYKYQDQIVTCKEWLKEDLEMPNHLKPGNLRKFMKLSFRNVDDLVNVRRQLQPQIEKNKLLQSKNEDVGLEGFSSGGLGSKAMMGLESIKEHTSTSVGNPKKKKMEDCMVNVVDIREYDVLYVQRVSIDTGYRCGLWYDVIPEEGTGSCTLNPRPDILDQAPLKKMAFDIETTKPPLKFPNAEQDNIMMISYMIDGDGFLICNRSIISEDVHDFEYTPRPEYVGVFTVYNEPDEKSLLEKWIEHIEDVKPHLYVTYNGDFFDWPFIAKRCEILGINLMQRIGIWESQGEYMGRFSVHLDAFRWVQRDSYLPQGSQGLKAVTKHKLKYEPVELDPEDMLPFARDRPQDLAAYSVSDAVATYYLYMKYVHLFVFSLATIIPMPPSDVLRKGSGTLCELLLMVQAFEKNIVSPNKEKTNPLQFHRGHLLESETYIGGHVECLESGVFRSDLPMKFKVSPKRMETLLENLDRTLKFAIEVEGLQKMENIDEASLAEVREAIRVKLVSLRDQPNIEVKPLIYHLDVGAMYPNIILTNRLQPMAIVDATICASCDFNQPGKRCQRWMKWSWRGRYFPATQAEFQNIKSQMEVETFKHDAASRELRQEPKSFADLPFDQQAARITARVKTYSNKVYKGFAKEDIEEKDACICQRENPFYVDTVRAFRDRRYEYKRLGKKAKQDVDTAQDELSKVKANDRLLLYDSLQLAHKCILNSFYGYVMRRGARWHSIEMAGVVTQTGANIIKDARVLVEEIGRPLELDTDGIWCMIPSTFPETYKVKLKNGKGAVPISYPCSMLNVLVADGYTNDQYWGKRPDGTMGHISECSIFFEVDGPYRAMVLPAAREEGKNIKKRYAVFAEDGSLAELKGFEIKRRGELKLIKIFQEQVFKKFLDGKTLQECYESVGSAANHWLDVCYNQGHDLEDEDVFELISENKSMSEALSDYGDRKSTSIQTARRLGEFLGEEMVKDKGLNCKFIITKKPLGAPTSERAVPVAIFSAEEPIKKSYLRKWLKDSSLADFDVRSLLDWDYYIGRLNSAIQKIITIPAAFQKIRNPVTRVPHPDWLLKRVKERDDTHKQTRIAAFFTSSKDMEDIGATPSASQFTNPLKPKFATVNKRRLKEPTEDDANAMQIDDGEERKEIHLGDESSPAKKSKQRAIGSPSGMVGGTGLLGDDPLNVSSSSSEDSPTSTKRQRKIVELDDDGNEIPDEDDDENEASSYELVDSNGNTTTVNSDSSAPSDLAAKAIDLSHLPPEKFSPMKKRRPIGDASSTSSTPSRARLALDFSGTGATPSGLKPTILCEEEPSDANFVDWMKSLKSNFNKINKARRESRQQDQRLSKGGEGARGEQVKLGRDGLRGFMKKANLAERASYWQIIQLFEDDQDPGLFRVWVVLDTGHIKQMLLRVPRIIYVNSRIEMPENGKKIERTLPRGRPCLNLYEISMPESEFKLGEKELHSSLQNRHEIEGIYETQVPLLFKVIMELGCCCKVDQAKQSKEDQRSIGGQPEYKLEQLMYKTTSEREYLTSVPIRKIYLYHSVADSKRGLFALFIEGEHEIRLIAVNGWPDQLEKVNAKKHLLECLELARQAGLEDGSLEEDGSETGRINMSQSFKLPSSNVKFSPVRVAKTHQAGFDIVSDTLQAFKDIHQGPSVVLAQVGGLSLPTLYSHLPILKTQFPLIMMSPNLQDNIYPSPPLPWWTTAVKSMIQRYVSYPRFWSDQLHSCRYAHVPIGNMDDDCPAFISDLFFARALKHSGHLLWMSKGSRPDLGGLEEDENYFADEHVNPESTKPGIYRKVCMQIDISNLAVNAIVQQQLIEEIESSANILSLGSSTAVVPSASADNELSSFRTGQESSASCLKAFSILKNCVGNWLNDVVDNQNADADMLLRHFYRWLRSPTSKLFDPALHRFIHSLMKKILAQLLARFSKLGSVIVYANQSRVIISTGKAGIAHALSYTKFILDTIRSKPLFERLDLVASKLWECLAWMDVANFGGVLAEGQDFILGENPEDGITTKVVRRVLDDDTESEMVLQDLWNIVKYLPNAPIVATPAGHDAHEYHKFHIRTRFKELIQEFIMRPSEIRQREMARVAEELRAKNALISPSQQAQQLQVSSEQEEENILKEISRWIETDFAQNVFSTIRDIKNHLRGDERAGANEASIDFPILAGSHLPLHNPALEFVKSICAIMSLDTELKHSVRIVRESLMKLVGIKSFSAQADFINPCLTFVLPDVICSFCNQCRDLDLCRDPQLLHHHWQCNICHQPYDKGVIEAMLVEFIQRRSVAYQVQDLQCITCGKIKVTNMSKYCPCSGQFTNTTSPQVFDHLMRTFSNISVYHQFEWLRETVTFIREREPEITKFEDPSADDEDESMDVNGGTDITAGDAVMMDDETGEPVNGMGDADDPLELD